MARTVPHGSPAALRRRLLAWFARARRDLPWRFGPGAADPYRVWISEAMLQQTQVSVVLPYYRRFLERFPTIEALARASEDEVLAAWAGLGYYARGRALLRAAKAAVSRHGGLPNNLNLLEDLPGFGPYTAGAVASIAFGLRAVAVDGNVGRVLARWAAIEAPKGTARFRREVEALAERMLPPPGARGSGEVNQALMELGALVCRPRSPRCDGCPFAATCAAAGQGRPEAFPVLRRRATPGSLDLGVALLTLGNRVLIEKRPSDGLFGGMWGPPTVSLGKTPRTAAGISRAIKAELTEKTGRFRPLGAVERTLTHRKLRLHVLAAPLVRAPAASTGRRLVAAGEAQAVAIPTALRAAMALWWDEA